MTTTAPAGCATSPVPGEHARPPDRQWDMPMTRARSMSSLESDADEHEATRRASVLRLVGAIFLDRNAFSSRRGLRLVRRFWEPRVEYRPCV